MEALRLQTAATSPVVSLDEIKDQLRVTNDAEDVYLVALEKAAERFVETYTRRQYVNATWKLTLDAFPTNRGAIELPRPPLSSVTSIAYLDEDGADQTMDSSAYRVDTESEPGRITPAWGTTWPTTRAVTGAVAVTYVAGYGTADASLPPEAKQAIRLLVAHWFEQREPVAFGGVPSSIPFSVESLLWSLRVPRVV